MEQPFGINNLVVFLGTVLFSTSLFAGPQSFSLQGQIVKPDGAKLEAASVNFQVQIYSPAPDNCLVYEETFSSVNMTGSKGLFDLAVGTGSRAGTDFEDTSIFSSIFNNGGPAVTPTTCLSGGPTYTPSATDQRLLRLSFDDGSGPVTLAQDHIIRSAPFAQQAAAVQGLGASDLLQVNTGTAQLTQADLEMIFAAPTDITELRALIDGTSSDYLVSSPAASVGFNNQRVTDVATPTAGTDATNKTYVDSNLGGNTISTGVLGAGEMGEVLTWNGTQWESQSLSAAGDVNNNGNTFAGLMTLGTNDNFGLNLETNGTPAVSIDNTQGVSLAAGLGVTGGINAGGNLNLLTESELRLEDAADGEYIGFKAPSTLTASQTFTLPDGDGASGEFLQTNGSGILVWAAPAAGDHDALGGLGDDDHTQYALLAGRAGGQSIIGGTAASNNLTLESSSDATKGAILLAPNGGNVGIGAATPGSQLHIQQTAGNTLHMPLLLHNFNSQNIGGSAVGLGFKVGSSADANTVKAMIAHERLAGSGRGTLHFLMNNINDTSNATLTDSKMVLDSQGRVGIGTTNPGTKLDVEGRITAGPIDATAGNTGSIVLEELAAGGTETVGFRAPDALAADLMWTLPSTLGTANQVLANSSTPGLLEWANQPSTSGFIAQGGNTLGTGMILGTNDSNWVDFIVNGTSRMTVETDGRLTVNRIGARNNVNKAALDLTQNLQVTFNQDGFPAMEVKQLSATSTDDILQLENNTGPVVVVSQAGQLGIGTTAASSALDVEGRITSGPIDATSGNTGSIVLEELAAGGTETVGFRAPDALAADLMWTLPSALGTANQVLRNSATPGVLEWAADVGATDHGALTGLTDDDHTQYARLGGRFGGQTLMGGSDAGQDLILQSTANATKGDVLINPNGGSVGIGSSTPDSILAIEETFAPSASNKLLGLTTIVSGSSASYNNTAGINAYMRVETTGAGGAEGYSANFVSVTGNDAKNQTAFGVNSDLVTHTTDTGYGFRSTSNSSSTGGTQYAFYSDISDADLDTRWGIYQNSGTANNYFAGNVGIGTNIAASKLDVEGRITSGPIDATAGNTGSILFKELLASGENTAGLRAPDTLAADLLWTLPSALGTANQVLRNSATPGVLEWATVTPGTGDIIDGGNTTGADVTIGTTDNFDLNLSTNGVVGMRLMNDGQVGIGTSDPNNAILHINANVPDAAFGSILKVQGNMTAPTNTPQSGLHLQPTVAPTAASTREFIGLFSNPGTSSANTAGADITSVTAQVTTSGTSTIDQAYGVRSFFQMNNTSAIDSTYGFYVDNPTGSGTIDSTYGLYIEDLTKGGVTNHAIFSQGNTPSFFGGSVGIKDESPEAYLEVTADGGSGTDYLMISTDDAGGDGDVLIVKDDGDVGIGTTVPGTKLDVEGRITAGPIDGTAGNTGSILFEDSDATNSSGIRAADVTTANYLLTLPATAGAANQVLSNTATPGVLAWTTPTTGTGDFKADGTVAMTGNFQLGNLAISNDGDTEGLRINTDGHVGINRAASSSKMLAVDGASQFESSIESPVYASRWSAGDTSDSAGNFRRFRSDAVAPGVGFGGYISLGLEGNVDSASVNASSLNWGWENAQTNGTTDRDAYFSIDTMADNSSSEKFRITSAGNVGIGTSSPDSSLEITPNQVSWGEGVVLNPASGGTNGYFLRDVAGSITGGWGLVRQTDNSIEFTREGLTGMTGTSGANVAMDISEAGLFRIGGSLGVGVSAPRGKIDVAGGSIVGAPAVTNATATIDFGTGNIQFTGDDCGAFNLHNLKDGGTYTFVVKGTGVGTCAFTAFSDAGTTGLTEHLPPDHAATTASTHTIYTAMVVGADVYFSWVPGY